MGVFRLFRISFLVMFLICLIIGTATAETWEKTFGGTHSDGGLSVQQTTDGGYIIAGDTYSFGKGGSRDFYLIKTDASGNQIWSKTFGGSDDELARCVQQTTDGGYIIAGEVWYETAGEDIYLVKTDASGKELWSKTLGLRTYDIAYSVQQTNDGGYIIVGETSTASQGYDVWFIKTDANGEELWSKTFGGANTDGGRSVQQTTDGGYIIAGHTSSFGAGGWNVYLIKTDDNGNEVWSKTFGGSTYDYGNSVQQTADGGYIICGFTGSFGAGATDLWLIKTDGDGNEDWSKTFGGSEYDRGWSVQQTSDDGYIIAGDTESFGAGSSDVYLVYVSQGADFVASPTMGPSPLSVNFTDQSTGEITSWQWDFGDGITSTEQNPSHIYSVPGTYTVSLTVADSEGPDTEIKNDYISVFASEPVQGTISTEVDISNLSLGEKKPKVLIGETKCKVLTFTSTSVSCLLKKIKSTMGPGTYDVTIIQKGKGIEPIVLPNVFSIMAPEIDTIEPNVGEANQEITITGQFFGTKKLKVYMDDGIKKKKCKVTFLTMDSTTGESELRIRVPKKGLVAGPCDVTVTNKVGEDTRVGGFTMQ